jgi:hypothetical protein
MGLRIVLKAAGLAAAGVVGAFAATAALAQTSPPGVMVSAEAASTPAQHLLADDWVINAGAFVLATNFDASLNGTASAGGASQDVNFGQDFGTNADATRVRADILWRFLPRHHLRFMYFDNDVKRTRTIDKDITWGDYTFLANGSVSAENKFTVYELAYEYAFMRDPNYEVVGSFGVHYEDFTIKLAGTATVTLPDGTVQTGSYQSKSSSLPAPLPVVGLRGGWAVTSNLHLDAQAQFFKFKVDAVDGHWWDLRAGATWMFTPHFGVGAGWDKFSTNVDVTKKAFNGSVNANYSGLVAYLTGSF